MNTQIQIADCKTNTQSNFKIMSKLYTFIASLAILASFSSCKPDMLMVEIYTSDLQKASSQGVVEVPLTATFSMLGEDEDGDLPKVSEVAKRYLDKNSEFKISKGEMGDVIVINCKIPMGTAESLGPYLEKNRRPLALFIEGNNVKLQTSRHLKDMARDLSDVNMVFSVDIPAEKTVIRFIGDLEEGPEINALAVFVDKKPELTFSKKIERRASVDLVYGGAEGSVYSEIEPQFSVK